LSSCAITSKDAETQYSESEMPTSNEIKLKDEFEKDNLNNSSIEAFEDRAIEKVKEFFEYANVVQDSSIDRALRKSAQDQCHSLFYKDIGIIGLNNKKYSVDEFLDSLYQNRIYLPSISDLLVSKKYQKSSKEDFYSGEIKFTYEHNGENGKVVTILIKSNKIFGEDVKEVWEVYLKEAML